MEISLTPTLSVGNHQISSPHEGCHQNTVLATRNSSLSFLGEGRDEKQPLGSVFGLFCQLSPRNVSVLGTPEWWCCVWLGTAQVVVLTFFFFLTLFFFTFLPMTVFLTNPQAGSMGPCGRAWRWAQPRCAVRRGGWQHPGAGRKWIHISSQLTVHLFCPQLINSPRKSSREHLTLFVTGWRARLSWTIFIFKIRSSGFNALN